MYQVDREYQSVDSNPADRLELQTDIGDLRPIWETHHSSWIHAGQHMEKNIPRLHVD
jgi:hypothetical protein